MGGKGTVIMPTTMNIQYHNRKYQVFLKMFEDQRSYENLMNII